MDSFRNIGLIGREGSGVAETLQRLITFLSSRDLNVILGEHVAPLLSDHGLRVCPRKTIGEICDLVIVVGGDGSLLGAARDLIRSNAPVLGVNRGRLGFLTDVYPDDLELKIGQVLDGEYTTEKRFMLDVNLARDGEPMAQSHALNDIVVNSGTSAHMMEFDLFIEGEMVYRQRSDGLIIATPTGSTAYSLSGGGPIMHPKLDAIALVPMFPHTLTSRPIVVEGNSEIKLVIREHHRGHAKVTCDGQIEMTCQAGDTIRIRKRSSKLVLIHPPGHSFYASCRDKLGWGAKLPR